MSKAPMIVISLDTSNAKDEVIDFKRAGKNNEFKGNGPLRVKLNNLVKKASPETELLSNTLILNVPLPAAPHHSFKVANTEDDYIYILSEHIPENMVKTALNILNAEIISKSGIMMFNGIIKDNKTKALSVMRYVLNKQPADKVDEYISLMLKHYPNNIYLKGYEVAFKETCVDMLHESIYNDLLNIDFKHKVAEHKGVEIVVCDKLLKDINKEITTTSHLAVSDQFGEQPMVLVSSKMSSEHYLGFASLALAEDKMRKNKLGHYKTDANKMFTKVEDAIKFTNTAAVKDAVTAVLKESPEPMGGLYTSYLAITITKSNLQESKGVKSVKTIAHFKEDFTVYTH